MVGVMAVTSSLVITGVQLVVSAEMLEQLVGTAQAMAPHA